MSHLERFNPVTKEDLEHREKLEVLSGDELVSEINAVNEKALNENVDSFYTLIEKETDAEKKEELELALKVCESVKAIGGLALVVGGYARDTALGKFGYNLKPKDIDIEVYGLDVDVLQERLKPLGDINVVGAAFGVIKLKGLDISIPRRDSKTGRGHKGFTIEGDPNMNIKEAAKRRDFTINALAYDPLTGEILDFYGGIEDIKQKTLRATDKETFVEDPLRVLRGVQFAARFGFSMDPETAELCRSLDLKELSRERIGEEWLKLLMKSPKPSVGLELAMELGVIDQLHPEIKALVGVPQSPKHHPEGDVWTHTKLVVDAAANVARENNLEGNEKLVLMLSALAHDFGKPATTKTDETGKITSYEHDHVGVPLAEKFLKLLNINQEIIQKVLLLVDTHMFVHMTKDANDSTIRRLARRLYPVSIKELAYLSTADTRGSMRYPMEGGKYPEAEMLVQRAEALSVKDTKPTPLIMGKDLIELGFKPGKSMGLFLKEIEELQLDGKITNAEEAKEYAREKFEKDTIETHRAELQGYGLQGLEGRLQRGLDPAGMLAVRDTRLIIEKICEEAGAELPAVEELTKALHVGAVWIKADDLAKAEKPEVRVWMLLAHECHEKNAKDLSTDEYIQDFKRIKDALERAEEDAKPELDEAVLKIAGEAKSHFVMKDGVAFSEEDAFIHMAIAGERSGVCKAGELYFVGAGGLNYSVLDGFDIVQREDRGRVATFYQKDGKDVVKKLYPGLAIVFGDEELALKLAKNAI